MGICLHLPFFKKIICVFIYFQILQGDERSSELPSDETEFEPKVLDAPSRNVDSDNEVFDHLPKIIGICKCCPVPLHLFF